MNEFAVIGLGNFGFNIVKSLAKRGKSVLAIDINPERVALVKDFTTDCVAGDIKDKLFVKEFMDDKISTVIISTGDNKFDSILAVHYMKELGIKRIIVKAVDKTHSQIVKIMGAHEIISPEKDIAEWWAIKLTEPNLLDHIPLYSDLSIVEYACPDDFSGKSLKNLKLPDKFRILILAVKDIFSEEPVFLPQADYILKPDSILILMGKKDDINRMKLTKY